MEAEGIYADLGSLNQPRLLERE